MMLELIGAITVTIFYSAVACWFAVSVWNCGFDEDGTMRFKSREIGYVFCILMGAFWPFTMFVFSTKKRS